MLFNFALEYSARIVLQNQVGLQMNGKHQLLAYDNGVNLVGNNIDAINKNMTRVQTKKV
jgi:hypothetical protein